MQDKKALKLKQDARFQCGSTVFGCDAGKIVYLLDTDKTNNKVLLDFGGGMIDWHFRSILSMFEPVVEPTHNIYKTDPRKRAELLRDQILKTWNPPYATGGESAQLIAATSAMQVIGFIFGKEFLGELSQPQQVAVDVGVEIMERVLLSPKPNN